MLPSIALGSGLIIMILLFIQSIVAFTGETEISKVTVLESRSSHMKLDLAPSGNAQRTILAMQGEYFAPVVRVIIFDDVLVFFGAKTWYRFAGMSSYAKTEGSEIALQKDIVAFPHPAGIPESLYAFFEKNESLIPGIKTAQTDIIQKRAKELASYSIRVQNDGGVEVIEIR